MTDNTNSLTLQLCKSVEKIVAKYPEIDCENMLKKGLAMLKASKSYRKALAKQLESKKLTRCTDSGLVWNDKGEIVEVNP